MKGLLLLAVALTAATVAYVASRAADRALEELGDIDWERVAEWSR